jgi:3',5'-cyclic AMP phosphodiesterase CpdA
MATILHISDLHFGRPFLPSVGEAVHALAEDLQPNLVIGSGDLVQWARDRRAWEEARIFFDRFRPPVLTIPGNHDVYRSRPVKRFFSLLQPYTRHFGGDGFSHFTSPARDYGVAGIWTPTPWSVDRGHISREDLRRTRAFFTELPPPALRILVQHQAALPRFSHRGIPTCPWGTNRALETYDDLGISLVLTGHNHFHHVERAPLPSGGHLIWAQCGTTTSRRVTRPAPWANSCTVLHLSPGQVGVQAFGHDPDAGVFIPGEFVTFDV